MNLGGWHIWGLNLNPDVEMTAVAIPSDVSARDWKEAITLPPAELKMGKTRVKVHLCGYRDLMDGRDVELFVSDMFNPGRSCRRGSIRIIAVPSNLINIPRHGFI